MYHSSNISPPITSSLTVPDDRTSPRNSSNRFRCFTFSEYVKSLPRCKSLIITILSRSLLLLSVMLSKGLVETGSSLFEEHDPIVKTDASIKSIKLNFLIVYTDIKLVKNHCHPILSLTHIQSFESGTCGCSI